MDRSPPGAPRAPTLPAPRALALAALLALAFGPQPVTAQSSPQPQAPVRLPSLGESVSDEVSVGAEKRLGEQIMREIRRDPDYVDDPLLLEYLQALWQPLVAAARARGDIGADIDKLFAWDSFLVRDRSVNAFALPGGYVGVHLGLIAMTGTRDELASVLAHELAHVSQRHIARSVTTGARQGTLAMAAMILGILAASRSGNPDALNATIVGGQAAMAQAQLNYSRDMEREADRVGYGVLSGAGFRPAGMAAMFEKLDHANRLNDSGAFPYLRSHPLSTERIGEARMRAGTSAAAATPDAAALLPHALMQARARVLMDASVTALRRQQGLDATAPTLPDTERLAAWYAAALASSLLRDHDRAERVLAAARATLDSPAGHSARRAFALLGAQLALVRGDVAAARARLPDESSRVALLMRGQVALASRQPAELAAATQALQSWVAEQRQDAAAWSLLAQVADAAGQPLRAVRAEAESRAAIGDLAGAIDRLRAGQRLAKGRSGGSDFMEASIIDARLRDLQAQQRQLVAELRGGRNGAPNGGDGGARQP
jgi:predicted Zn-dependent protease